MSEKVEEANSVVDEKNVIGRECLSVDATVPQCVDNQYVSPAVFNKIASNNLDFNDPAIKADRSFDTATEFNRALVYTSQVVINRAYFRNAEFLYSKYAEESSQDFQGFSELLRTRAIIPFLFKNESASTEMVFNQDDFGTKAAKRLFKNVGSDALFVRLSTDQNANIRLAKEMEVNFKTYFTNQRFYDTEHRKNILTAITNRSVSDQEFNVFERNIKELRHDIENATDQNRQFGRNEIYKKWFIRGTGEVVNGGYHGPDTDNPLRFELKKLVDLRYNTNLPDFLQRTSFTPMGMPSRLALQDLKIDSVSQDAMGSFMEDSLPRLIREDFCSRTREAMQLPFLHKLSAADLIEVRKLQTRDAFIDGQKAILTNPFQLPDLFDDFQKSFCAFQKEFSSWFDKNKRFPAQMENLCAVVSVGVVVAGSHYFDIDLDYDLVDYGQKFVLPEVVPDKIKGLGVKLLFTIYDQKNRIIKPDYSYSLELMNSAAEYTKNDVQIFLNKLKEARETRRNQIVLKEKIKTADVGRE